MEGFDAIAGHVHLVAPHTQDGGHQVADPWYVVHYEDASEQLKLAAQSRYEDVVMLGPSLGPSVFKSRVGRRLAPAASALFQVLGLGGREINFPLPAWVREAADRKL